MRRWRGLAAVYAGVSPAFLVGLAVLRFGLPLPEGWGGWALGAGMGRALLLGSAAFGGLGLLLGLVRWSDRRARLGFLGGALVGGAPALAFLLP